MPQPPATARENTLLDSALGLIGQTPMVELTRFASGHDGRILAKVEFLNPGLSKKDRIAQQMLNDALASGELRPGQPVVELTSGNTGTGLAIVCAVKGHPFIAVMSKGNSPERARMMRALGAEVVLVDQAPGGTPGRVTGADIERIEQVARRLTRERGAFRADQFSLPGNARAHERHTGPEMLRQSGGAITAFCDFAGTAGTFVGVSRALKRANPDIRCFLVEPAEAAVLRGEAAHNPHHRIQGGGYAKTDLPLFDPSLVATT